MLSMHGQGDRLHGEERRGTLREENTEKKDKKNRKRIEQKRKMKQKR